MESNPRETSAKTNGGVCGGRKQKREHFHFFNRVLAGPTLMAFNGVLCCIVYCVAWSLLNEGRPLLPTLFRALQHYTLPIVTYYYSPATVVVGDDVEH